MSNYSHSLPRPVHHRASGTEEHGDFSAVDKSTMDESAVDQSAVGGPAVLAGNAASNAANSSGNGSDSKSVGNDSKTGNVSALKTAEPLSRTLNTNMAQTWLAWQCKMIAGIIHGSLYFPTEDRLGLNPVSRWPKDASSELSLSSVSRQVLKSKKPLVLPRYKYGPGNQRVCDLVACPLLSDGEVIAVVACGISTRSEAQQQAIMQLLQWGSLWLDTLLQQQSVAAKEHGAFVHRLLALSMSHRSSHAACIETTNQLAAHFGCDRVSIGFSDSLQIRLRAISGLADYDSRTEMARQIEAAMEEAVNQQQFITLPELGGASSKETLTSTHAHDVLSKQQKHATVCSVPLPNGLANNQQIIGAITFERSDRFGFSADELAHFNLIATVLGPMLALKRRDERSMRAKALDSVQQKLSRLLGAEYFKLKVGTAIASFVLLFAAVVDGNHRITAPANIEAAARQVLVAPVDGYIHHVELRAGDRVNKGQLIAALQDDTLQLEKKKWQGEYLKIEKEYQQALAERDRSKLSILRAQLDQLKAEQQLVDEKLSRTRLTAPFDGMIVSGDLSQSLGAPVKTGDVLYEVAPIDNYRVTVEIDEFDMGGLNPGKRGKLIVAAMPGKPIDVTLDQFIPVAVAADGRNYFRIEATIAGETPELRPGMRGVAKIDVGERKLLWIWTHAVVDRIRMWAWSVGL